MSTSNLEIVSGNPETIAIFGLWLDNKHRQVSRLMWLLLGEMMAADVNRWDEHGVGRGSEPCILSPLRR
jgi:hypothetical protein